MIRVHERDSSYERKRIVYLDYLRIMATYAVVILHVVARPWTQHMSITDEEWVIVNAWNAAARWAVPVFVMISGALWIPREIDWKDFYRRHFAKMVYVFLIWSMFYSIVYSTDKFFSVTAFLQGNYHMWYILMIGTLYLFLPFVKKITETDLYEKYYLVLSICFAFVLPQIADSLISIGGKWPEIFGTSLGDDLNDANASMVMGYTGYFILGDFLNRTEIGRMKRFAIYGAGVLGYFWCFKIGGSNNFALPVFMEAVALFVFAKYCMNRSNGFIQQLSKYSFGAYLIHAWILTLLDEKLHIYAGCMSMGISAFITVTIAFIISFLISALLNQLPYLHRFLV